MTDEWVTKLNAEGRPLLLGIAVNGELVDFGDLDTPLLRMRRATAVETTALSFEVVDYNDTVNSPALYNAQVVFSDWTELSAGLWIADVVATYADRLTVWPDDSYIKIRILRSMS